MATQGLVRRARERWRSRRSRRSRSRGSQPRSGQPPVAPARAAYRGDFAGRATIDYAPRADGHADPGEVVWAWVPYEDDPRQGKDRPVLVIARSGEDLLGLMLTSKDHVGGARPRDDRPDAPVWLDLGSGAWDRKAGRARCAWTGCCGSRPATYDVRAGRWTGPASSRWRPPCGRPTGGRSGLSPAP